IFEKTLLCSRVSKSKSPIIKPKKNTAITEAKDIKTVSFVASHTRGQFTLENSVYCSNILRPILKFHIIFDHLYFYFQFFKFLNFVLNGFFITYYFDISRTT